MRDLLNFCLLVVAMQPWIETPAVRLLAAAMTTLTALTPPALSAPTPGDTLLQRAPVLPVCPAGTYLESTRQVECRPCQSGVSYTATANRLAECLKCNTCRGLLVESPCNATHDTVCRCPAGQYVNVDGGCTIVASSSGKGMHRTTKSSITQAATSQNDIRPWEKESTWTIIDAVISLFTVAGIVVIIVKTFARDNCCGGDGNGHCCKQKPKLLGRGPRTDETAERATEVPLLNRRNSHIQADAPNQAEQKCKCCAKAQAALEKEAAEHARTKKTLAAKKRQLANSRASQMARIYAAVEQLRRQQTFMIAQRTVAVDEQLDSLRPLPEANRRHAATSNRSGNGELPSTETTNRLSEIYPDHVSPEKQALPACVEGLQRKIKDIVDKSNTSNNIPAILLELKVFFENFDGHVETVTEAPDRETRNITS